MSSEAWQIEACQCESPCQQSVLRNSRDNRLKMPSSLDLLSLLRAVTLDPSPFPIVIGDSIQPAVEGGSAGTDGGGSLHIIGPR